MKFMGVRAALLVFFSAVSIVLAVPVHAGPITRDGFAFPTDRNVKVVVFRPDVYVGSLRVGGLDDPNPDWTSDARRNIQEAMENAAEAHRSRFVFLGDFEGEDGKLLADYRGLFEAVSSSMFYHVTLMDGLPTKLAPRTDPKERKRYRLDWTLGEGARRLRDVTGGDYAMFFYTHDSYGDAGRKVAQFLMAGIFGSYVPAGIHLGYAGLVDLSTGEVVWFNTDLAMGGDVRQSDGAVKRVGQLLKGLPEMPEGTWSAEPDAVPAAASAEKAGEGADEVLVPDVLEPDEDAGDDGAVAVPEDKDAPAKGAEG